MCNEQCAEKLGVGEGRAAAGGNSGPVRAAWTGAATSTDYGKKLRADHGGSHRPGASWSGRRGPSSRAGTSPPARCRRTLKKLIVGEWFIAWRPPPSAVSDDCCTTCTCKKHFCTLGDGHQHRLAKHKGEGSNDNESTADRAKGPNREYCTALTRGGQLLLRRILNRGRIKFEIIKSGRLVWEEAAIALLQKEVRGLAALLHLRRVRVRAEMAESLPMEHLDNLKLQIPIFRLGAEVDEQSAAADQADVEDGAVETIEEVHYLLHAASLDVPSPLPAEMLPHVRTASLLEVSQSFTLLEAAVVEANLRCHDLLGYDSAVAWVESSPCVVCRVSPRQMELLPCGHRCTCEFCAKGLNRCPMCRENIVKFRRLRKRDRGSPTRSPSTSRVGSPVLGRPSTADAGGADGVPSGLVSLSQLPQPIASDPKPLALEYAIVVPAELNPKLRLPKSLTVKHSMTLGPNPFKHGFPPALLIPLTVKREHCAGGTHVRPRKNGGSFRGAGGHQSAALQKALGLHSANLLCGNQSPGVNGRHSPPLAMQTPPAEWELAAGIKPYDASGAGAAAEAASMTGGGWWSSAPTPAPAANSKRVVGTLPAPTALPPPSFCGTEKVAPSRASAAPATVRAPPRLESATTSISDARAGVPSTRQSQQQQQQQGSAQGSFASAHGSPASPNGRSARGTSAPKCSVPPPKRGGSAKLKDVTKDGTTAAASTNRATSARRSGERGAKPAGGPSQGKLAPASAQTRRAAAVAPSSARSSSVAQPAPVSVPPPSKPPRVPKGAAPEDVARAPGIMEDPSKTRPPALDLDSRRLRHQWTLTSLRAEAQIAPMETMMGAEADVPDERSPRLQEQLDEMKMVRINPQP